MAVLPLFGVTYPPLSDLPNHLARIAVLRAAEGSPLLDYYQVHWAIIPNLATDLLLLGASQFMSLALASKLLVALIAIGWIVGPLALHYAVYRRLSIAPLIGAAFLFNRALAMGFMNFTFGAVAVVFALAIWILLERKSAAVRLLAAIALAAAVFFSHLFIAAIFLIAIGLWELLPWVRRSSPFALRALLVAAASATIALGWFLTPREALPTWADGWPTDPLGFVAGGVMDMAAFLQAGSFWSILSFIALGIAIVVALFRRPDLRLGLITASLLLLLFVLPSNLMGGANVDFRMLAPFCLFAAAWLPFRMERWGRVLWPAFILILLTAQIAAVSSIWQRDEARYQRLHAIVTDVPEGARLYSVALLRSTPPGERTYVYGTSGLLHYASYATVERSVVVPSLFARAPQQPMVVRAEYATRHAELAHGMSKAIDTVDWPAAIADFDYVLIVVGGTVTTPPGLVPLDSDGIFHLFRVTR
ncbi:MAG: hypothetical protein EOP22_13285 [Hyphomicrobiales bacterium]|nr:MAG: hypothetical protein EOP22_13285 [Hyphomicrobiales bacterium]